MKTLIKGKAETLIALRNEYSNPLSSVVFRDSEGSEVGTPLITQGNTSEALTSSSSRNEYYIYCNNLEVGKHYALITNDNKTLKIKVLGVNGSTVEISDPLPFDIDSGNVYSLEDTISITIPATYDFSSVQIEYTWSDGTETIDEALTIKRRLSAPLADEDLYRRWSRLRGSAPVELNGSFSQIIDEAVNILRLDFWQQGYVLDNIRTPTMIRELVFAQTAVLLADMGYDPIGAGDMLEFRREMQKKLSQETQNLINSRNLWIDDGSGSEEDGERGTVGMSLRWD